MKVPRVELRAPLVQMRGDPTAGDVVGISEEDGVGAPLVVARQAGRHKARSRTKTTRCKTTVFES